MTERAPKRPRALSTEDESSEAEEDWQRERLNASNGSTRSRRGQAAAPQPDQPRLRLTAKQPSSRLRNVTNASDALPRGSRDSLGRASKNKKPIVDDSSDEEEDEEDDVEDDEERDEDDEEQDEEEDGDEEEDDEEGGDEDEEMDDQNDDEEEDDEEDEDEEMEDATPVAPPRIKISAPIGVRKASPSRTLKLKGNVKSVEEKELESTNAGLSDDDELSDLESQLDDETGQLEDGMEDDEAGDVIAADDVGEDELDSSDLDSELDGSRAGTPDLSKLTRRQRAHFEAMDGNLLALSNEAQKKKIITPEQQSMRRAEMARKRKDLSKRRNEEEKADTLNRLLHKQAPKRRSKAQMLADAERDEFGTPAAEEEERRAGKMFSRTIINNAGTVIAMPDEWLAGPAGKLFAEAKKQEPGKRMVPGRLVEVIE